MRSITENGNVVREDCMDEARRGRHRQAAERTAEAQLRLQAEVDRRDRERKHAGEAEAEAGAVQAGPRKYPENPLPRQHHEKTDLESELEPRPRDEAPD